MSHTSVYKVKLNCKNCVAGVTEHLEDAFPEKVDVNCDLSKQTVTVHYRDCSEGEVFDEIKKWSEDVDHGVPERV